MTASEDSLGTVGLPARLAVFASMTDILDRLVASPLADLKLCDLFSNLDDDASSLMTSTFRAQVRHLR